MCGLRVSNLSKTFGSKGALSDVNLEIGNGELLVLLGPSGCGKSTLLRIIAGLEVADSGQVHIEGRRVDHLRPRERSVAMVFQNYSLYPHMSVRKNIAFALKIAGVARAEIESRVQKVATMLGLEERLNDRPGQLSGGQRQRVALGRAIIREPSVFLLDEPLSNLDAELRSRMRREIVRIQRELGKTMIHVTHDQTEALTMADRIALLRDGRLEQLGTPQELYQQPTNHCVAQFIGLPMINLVEAELQDNELVPFGIVPPQELRQHILRSGCVIGLRPETISISADGEYQAETRSLEYLGDHYVVELDYAGQRLRLSTTQSYDIKPGQSVRFNIEKISLLYFDRETGKNLQG